MAIPTTPVPARRTGLADPGPPAASSSPGSGLVRPFRRGDIAAVVELRRQVFQRSEHETAEALAEYLEQVFFDAPWVAADLPSLVYEQDGEIAGFLGVIPRRFHLRGRSLRAAVATQLLVRAGLSGLPGLRLARAFIDGPQDLSLSDTANDAARTLWERIGGLVSLPYSLAWTLPLQPARHRAGSTASGVLRRVVAYLGRPVTAAMDTFHRLPPLQAGDVAEPLRLPEHLPELDRVFATWDLSPEYDSETLSWLRAHLSRKSHYGALEQVLVRDRVGEVVGWFLYCRNAGGVAQVAQLGCRAADYPRVISQLAHHARRRRVVALAGRLDPPALGALAACGATFTRQGPWMLLRSPHPEVLDAVQRGGALISRLEGEWWLGF